MKLQINTQSGLLNNVNYIASPNCDERPHQTVIDLLVIHGISLPPGNFDSDAIIQFFTNHLNVNEHPYFKEIAHLKVSSHILIRRQGDIIQFVPFNKRAWHAGKSIFQSRSDCNDFSIGIELEGTDTTSYTDQQYEKLAEITAALQQCYPGITDDRIVGHSDIAPGRKTDPGDVFDWNLYRQRLQKRKSE